MKTLESILDTDLDVTEKDLQLIQNFCRKHRKVNYPKFRPDTDPKEFIRLLEYDGGIVRHSLSAIDGTNAIKSNKYIFRIYTNDIRKIRIWVPDNKRFYCIALDDPFGTWNKPYYTFPCEDLMRQVNGVPPDHKKYVRWVITDFDTFEKVKQGLA